LSLGYYIFPIIIFIIGSVSVFEGRISDYQYWVLILLTLIYCALIGIFKKLDEKL